MFLSRFGSFWVDKKIIIVATIMSALGTGLLSRMDYFKDATIDKESNTPYIMLSMFNIFMFVMIMGLMGAFALPMYNKSNFS